MVGAISAGIVVRPVCVGAVGRELTAAARPIARFRRTGWSGDVLSRRTDRRVLLYIMGGPGLLQRVADTAQRT